MANRYVRAAGGNWTTAGTWELTPGGGEVVAIPTSADQVYLVVGSGQLTINAAAACRAMDCTGYANSISHSSFTLTIGDGTAPAGGVALKLAGGYSTATVNAAIVFESFGTGVHIVDYAGKTIGNQSFNGTASYQLVNSFTCYFSDSIITLTSGTLNYNGVTQTTGYFATTGFAPRTLTLGATTFANSKGFSYTGSGLTVTANTALVELGTWAATFGLNGANWNGLSLKAAGTNTVSITGGGTIKNFYMYSTGANFITVQITSATTLVCTGDIYTSETGTGAGVPYLQSVTSSSAATISKASGTAWFYGSGIKDITATGGATFNAVGCTNTSNNTGINFLPATYYLDYELGTDSGNGNAYGWWKVAYTGATGTAPSTDETVNGATSASTAKVTFVDLYEWNVLTAGTIYFYGKSAPFVAEQVNCAVSGGHFDIATDFSYASWKTLNFGAMANRIAPGDILRMTQSSPPTAVGVTGTWTGVPATTTKYTKSIVSTTSASPINVKVTAHGYATGDCIYIQNHTLNLIANGTWKITYVDADNFTLDGSLASGSAGGATGTTDYVDHHCVKLSANASTQTITRCEQAWSPANAASVTLDTNNYKEGDASVMVVKASPANNTLYAYFATGTLNLGTKQKVSFWIRNSTTILVNQWKLCLCSDTAGATIVDTIAIPAIPSTVQWVVLTIVGDNANLGASIQSVALWSGSAAATTGGIYLDNIIACTTSGLNLCSLISKNATLQGTPLSSSSYGDEGWYGIQSISEDGKVIRLDNDTNTLPYQNIFVCGGYSTMGTSPETVDLYKRETIKTDIAASTTTSINYINETGVNGYPISIQGGYSTATNTQIGETFFDGANSRGYGISITSVNYININYISFARVYAGIIFSSSSNYCIVDTITNANNCWIGVYFSSGTNNTVNTIGNVNNSNMGLFFSAAGNTVGTVVNCNNHNMYCVDYNVGCDNLVDTYVNVNNSSSSFFFYASANNNVINTITNVFRNSNPGFYFQNCSCNYIGTITNVTRCLRGITFSTSHYNTIENITADYNSTAIQFYNSSHNKILTMSATGSVSEAIINTDSINFIRNALLVGTEFSGAIAYTNSRVYSEKHDQTPDNDYIYTDGGVITSDVTNRHTASGICWKMAVTSVTRTSNYPLNLSIAKVACVANKVVTVSAWFKVTNITDIRGALVCKEGQLGGYTTQTSITPNVDTNYRKLSISFTPNEAGVVEIEAWAYWTAGTADESVYVDDMLITQAA